MSHNPILEYQKTSKEINQDIYHVKKSLNIFFTFRLILGTILISLVFLYFFNYFNFIEIIILIIFLIFVLIIRNYHKIKLSLEHYQKLIEINRLEILYLKKGVYKTTNTHVEKDHPYANDLDIIGEYSLLNNIDRTCNHTSKEYLIKSLTDPKLVESIIYRRQYFIKKLTNMLNFRQNFACKGSLYLEQNTEKIEFLNWVNSSKSTLTNFRYRLMSIILSILTIFFLIAGLFEFVNHTYWIVLFFINLISISILSRKNKITIWNKSNYLEKYTSLMELISNEKIDTGDFFQSIEDDRAAFMELNKLLKIVKFYRNNNFLTKGLLLPDIHLIYEAEIWKEKNRSFVNKWFEKIYWIDEINSFANFAFNHSDFTYPALSKNVDLHCKNLGHPLMFVSNSVKNNFIPETKSIILTGANMSGKSTFLRSIGINLVLAYSGAPVCADEFTCSLGKIFTCMRISDSLSENSSYFYAELKKLSQIVNELKNNNKLFILLDEILKGTNSDDKFTGSVGLVEELFNFDCINIFATHDLEMGKLEEKHPFLVSNYCFESNILIDTLIFDYKIKKGIAKNKNATFLMKKMNIIK